VCGAAAAFVYPDMPRTSPRSRLAWPALLLTLAAGACGDDPPTQPTTTPPPPTPAPTVTAGRIVQSPAGVGIVLATTFTFTAEGFAASNNGALAYTWDFGDGVRQTGGVSVTHVYPGRGVFTVGVSAALSTGQSAAATLPNVAATTLDGRWGLQDITGTFIMNNTSLSQNATALTGDDTRLNCRFAVTGSVQPQRDVTVTWNRARNDCQAYDVPETVRFTGTADEAAGGFVGMLDTGTPARLVFCQRPGC
jgi:hypothetical protein